MTNLVRMRKGKKLDLRLERVPALLKMTGGGRGDSHEVNLSGKNRRMKEIAMGRGKRNRT